MNWNEVFRILNLVREELKDNFPYKVVHMEGAEADDIIGALVQNTQEFGNHEPVMIISSDKDFIQLHKYSNVKTVFTKFKRKLFQIKILGHIVLNIYVVATRVMVYQIYYRLITLLLMKLGNRQ